MKSYQKRIKKSYNFAFIKKKRRDLIPCVILCGGQSKRMQSPKEALDFYGKTFAQYQYLRCKEIFTSVYFSAKKNIESFPTLIEKDEIHAPLFGLQNILETLKKDCFVLSIDTPSLSKDSIQKIIENYKKTQSSTFAKNSKIHPLLGIYTHKTLPFIKEQIANEDYKLMNLLAKIRTDFVEICEKETQNLNTKQDYQNFIKSYLNG